jgi:hypothetical protein
VEESARRLAASIQEKFKHIVKLESINKVRAPRTLNRHAFTFLLNSVSIWAVRQISKEWEATKQAIEAKSLLPTFTPCQECEFIIRWSLPCRHHLAQAYMTGQPIPRSLIHPR